MIYKLTARVVLRLGVCFSWWCRRDDGGRDDLNLWLSKLWQNTFRLRMKRLIWLF